MSKNKQYNRAFRCVSLTITFTANRTFEILFLPGFFEWLFYMLRVAEKKRWSKGNCMQITNESFKTIKCDASLKIKRLWKSCQDGSNVTLCCLHSTVLWKGKWHESNYSLGLADAVYNVIIYYATIICMQTKLAWGKLYSIFSFALKKIFRKCLYRWDRLKLGNAPVVCIMLLWKLSKQKNDFALVHLSFDHLMDSLLSGTLLHIWMFIYYVHTCV